ncbi:MAG: hypothetical protein QM538_05660 [Methylacidiphilales bacterium]|nr:hypothetical protein [Candidatus Methylacidiphilales bacterium]
MFKHNLLLLAFFVSGCTNHIVVQLPQDYPPANAEFAFNKQIGVVPPIPHDANAASDAEVVGSTIVSLLNEVKDKNKTPYYHVSLVTNQEQLVKRLLQKSKSTGVDEAAPSNDDIALSLARILDTQVLLFGTLSRESKNYDTTSVDQETGVVYSDTAPINIWKICDINAEGKKSDCRNETRVRYEKGGPYGPSWSDCEKAAVAADPERKIKARDGRSCEFVGEKIISRDMTGYIGKYYTYDCSFRDVMLQSNVQGLLTSNAQSIYAKNSMVNNTYLRGGMNRCLTGNLAGSGSTGGVSQPAQHLAKKLTDDLVPIHTNLTVYFYKSAKNLNKIMDEQFSSAFEQLENNSITTGCNSFIKLYATPEVSFDYALLFNVASCYLLQDKEDWARGIFTELNKYNYLYLRKQDTLLLKSLVTIAEHKAQKEKGKKIDAARSISDSSTQEFAKILQEKMNSIFKNTITSQ